MSFRQSIVRPLRGRSYVYEFASIGVLLLSSRSWPTTCARVSVPGRVSVPTTGPIRSISELRDYQEECIQSVLSAFEQGHKRVGISLATGSGKTVVFTQLIDRVEPRELPYSEPATQTLIIAHRKELVAQAARHCNATYPGKTVDIEMGNLRASGAADVTIASVYSLSKEDRLAKYDPDRFKLVIVDEAHHIVASTYMKVLEHFGLEAKSANSPYLVGVSATFSRFDGLRLGAAIDEIVYHRDYVDMIEAKWLTDVLFTTVQSTADLSKVETNGARGDFNISSLSKAVNTDEVNEITVKTWFSKASDRKSTLVFCVDIAHVEALTAKFRDHGVDARYVTSETHDKTRSELLDAFKRGDFPVLVNCGVYTEGTDIPNIDCVLLARPIRSRTVLVQMIGRGMRLHPGKKNCHIIDMVSSLETGIVTTPTLFGLDPKELVDKMSVGELRERRQERTQEETTQIDSSKNSGGKRLDGDALVFTHYDSVFDLIDDTSGEQQIRSLSPNAWLQITPNRYILYGVGNHYLRLDRTTVDGTDTAIFRACLLRRLPPGAGAPYAKAQELFVAATLEDGVHGCDKYAKETADMFPYSFIAKRASWRFYPATQGQLRILNRFRPEDSPLRPRDMRKGRATDLISKLKHGAQGRFDSLKADQRRAGRARETEERRRDMVYGQSISVGPVLAPT